MQIIPIQDVPSQTFNVQLANQNCQIDIYTAATGLFVNVSVNNVLIIGGVIAQNLNRIVRSLYLGFIGDFVFNDTQGTSDPSYPGLGTRFEFWYLTPAELGGLG